ncbi:MAG: ATP-binding cassette domain-containing protein [Calditrichia bacterium]|nr:ATP-binding cassette domain-containing protein [Calditrichota bacterium]MCB0270404.1 ATP-binding cassette domain-containing protein [Calditrichota bacterium]MCB0286934.1 ATP-binding cassette domain-containing protein [Calditrichota bacterium]MCB9067899.1 ATP-binding cassette domain-containing protein [Calditrichia bacterium]
MIHVKAENLCKEINERTAVENVSFEVQPGRVLGILGAENAGKTTILRMLMELVPPDSGSVSFDERMISPKVRDATGYLPQRRGLLKNHTVNELLIYFAQLKNLPRKKARVEAVRLMDRFQIIDQMDTKVHLLTEEMRQKVAVMLAIIHNPDLLILDEPFLEQHPGFIKLVRKLVQRFRDEGKTLILASRDFDEAEILCDDVLVLQDGQTLLQGNLAEIRNRSKENMIEVFAHENLESLQSIYGVKQYVLNHRSAQLFVDSKVPPQKILDVIVKTVNATRIEVCRPGLREIVNQMTNL